MDYQKFIQEKARKKREIFGSMFFPRSPVLFIDFSNAKRSREYADFLQGLEEIHLTTLVIPSAQMKNLPQGKHLRYISAAERERALEAADFTLMVGQTGRPQNGCVPIALQNGDSTVNYNPLRETGNGFYFKNKTKWEMFAAVVRAMETYQFPYDWENLVKEILP